MPAEEAIFELTADEAAKLKEMGDPDAESGDTFKKWDDNLQREILALLLHDRSFLLECVSLIKPTYFTNEAHQKICAIVFEHFEQYRTVPKKTQITQELKEKLEGRPDPVKANYYQELGTVLEFYVPNLEDRDYYRHKIVNFAKQMALKNAFRKSVDVMKKAPESDETWAEIAELLKGALSVEQDFEEGLDYFGTVDERYARQEDNKAKGEIFTTGFKAIDEGLKKGGLLRGEIGAWMGLSGTGKSLALVTAALANLHLGKKVLYVTLEIDQDAVAERFDAQLAALQGKKGVTVNNLLSMKQQVAEALNEYTEDYNDKKLMVIKRFSSGSLDVPAFRAYFSQITMRGFRPDLVIIDYIGEMKDYPGIPTHESRYRIVRDLRGFGVEEEVCVFTALQPNKSAKEVVRSGLMMDDENLGDSYAQVKPLDALWSLNQLLDEKNCGLGRGFVSKHREGKSKYSFHIKFNWDTLSIVQISKEEYETTFKKYKMMEEKRNTDILSKEMADSQLDAIIGKGNKKQPKVKMFGNDAGYDTNEADAPPEPPE
jgi:replicative DNA helicase